MGLFDSKPATKVGAKKIGAAKKVAAKRVFGKPRASAVDEDGDGVAVTSGWGGAKKMKAEYSGYANRFEMDPGKVIVRFLDDAPYANVATHWITRKGRQSFICLGSKTCPLCALGDKPRVAYCFNLIQLTDGAPIHTSLECGVRLYNQIEKKSQSVRYGPLSKAYYTLERVGKGKDDTVYTLTVIKKIDDIEDEELSGVQASDIAVPTEAEFKKLIAKGYTKEDALKGKPSLKEMKELAAEQLGEEPDDDEE